MYHSIIITHHHRSPTPQGLPESSGDLLVPLGRENFKSWCPSRNSFFIEAFCSTFRARPQQHSNLQVFLLRVLFHRKTHPVHKQVGLVGLAERMWAVTEFFMASSSGEPSVNHAIASSGGATSQHQSGTMRCPACDQPIENSLLGSGRTHVNCDGVCPGFFQRGAHRESG